MQIIINGQIKELSATTNLKDVITRFCKDSRRVISEVNGDIIKSSQWPNTPINDGDTIELVTLVGGG